MSWLAMLALPSLVRTQLKTRGSVRYLRSVYRPHYVRWASTTVSPKVAVEEVKAGEDLAPVACAEPPVLFVARAGRLMSVPDAAVSHGTDIVISPPVRPVPPAAEPVQEWHQRQLDIARLSHYYMALSKIRLTGLVVTTTLAGYAMAPGAFDPWVLLFTVAGTAFTSCAANAINQFLEVPYDSQMNRTKNRVLVRGFLSPLHAVGFAAGTASLGLWLLAVGANGLTALLGGANLALYTCAYTPLKRCSIVNTWLGSVVGAIPPLMGWAACMGTLDAGACVLGAMLYSWQFPHFNALSWNLRPDYSRAGYRMMSVTHPELCRRTALRHSVLLALLCSCAAPLSGLTAWSFAATSLPLNAYLLHRAWRFYSEPDSATSRALFRLSLVYLPVLIVLMLISKRRDCGNAKPAVSTVGSLTQLPAVGTS